ncbi:neuropeptide Y receptor type 1-like [Chironomus tepperi]|uniref:neuropeptide Y receptor type 1-like n=1 Tax=Chironomus tepperi TaxID=113505 RepID=UPI00391FB98D
MIEDDDYNIVTDIEEFEWEYFEHRPVALAFHVIIGITISFTGFIGNLIIFVMKLKKRRDRNGIVILILNVTFMLLIASFLLILFIIDDTHHDSTGYMQCLVRNFLQEFSFTSKSFSYIALIIVARFYPKLSARNGIYLVIIIWLVACLYGYPHYDYEIALVPLSNDNFKSVCAPIIYPGDKESYFTYIITMFTFQHVVPTILYIAILITTINWEKNANSSQNRNIFLYAATLGFICNLSIVPVMVIIMELYISIEVSYGWLIIMSYLSHILIVLNPIVYFYFDKGLFKEICEIYRVIDLKLNGEEDPEVPESEDTLRIINN